MTEAEWLASTDPHALLGSLSGKTSDRSLRLFALACCRRVERFLPDDGDGRREIEAAEQFADGPLAATAAPRPEFVLATAASAAAFAAAAVGAASAQAAASYAAYAASTSSCLLETGYANDEGWSVARVWSVSTEHFDPEELAFQAALLRHIVGNPFRPHPPLLHVAANVRALAESAYQQDQRALGPLHDALLDAGLAELAGHFASEREGHPKGCWALDVLTGRT